MLLKQARAILGYHLPPFIPRPGFVVRAASFDAQGSAHHRSRERRICSMPATKGELLWSVKGDVYGTNSVMSQLPLKGSHPWQTIRTSEDRQTGRASASWNPMRCNTGPTSSACPRSACRRQ